MLLFFNEAMVFSLQELSPYCGSFLFSEPFLLLQQFVEFPLRCIFQNEVHSSAVIEVSIETENIGVPGDKQREERERERGVSRGHCKVKLAVVLSFPSPPPEVRLYLYLSPQLMLHLRFLELRLKQHLQQNNHRLPRHSPPPLRPHKPLTFKATTNRLFFSLARYTLPNFPG